jgi:DNA-binding NtrC family response regulator
MEGYKVLVVDDEADFRETIVKRLQKRGLEVAGAESGPQALEMIETRAPDVIVLDIKMPGMDGIETLKAIKERKPLIEIILLTGHASLESGIEGMKLGAFDFVLKPVALEALLDKMNRAYEKKIVEETR